MKSVHRSSGRQIIFLLTLTVIIWIALYAIHSNVESRSIEVPLKDITGISQNVLNAQGTVLHIEDPVPYFSQDKMYLFTVTILNKRGFGSDLDYEFCGDAESINLFLCEVVFVNSQHAGLLNKSCSFATGAGEDVRNMVKSIVNLVFHPVDTLTGLSNAGPVAYHYFQDVYHGKRAIIADAKEFASAYVENVYMEVASTYELNYQELRTEEAKASIRSLAHPKIAGMAITEIVTLFVAWVKIAKVADVTEVANAASETGKAAESANIATKTGHTATAAARWPALFEYGAKAELGATRMARAAAVAEKISALDRLKPLLEPAKVAPLKGDRALNSRLHKVLYWLYQSEKDGKSPSETLTRAMKMAKADRRLSGTLLDPRIDYAQILNNYKKAKELNVFNDAENLDLMRRGNAPWVNTANGLEQIWVEHAVPVSKAPELGNCWGNLLYETRSRNLEKSDNITETSISKLEEYKKAGLMTQDRIDKITGTAIAP